MPPTAPASTNWRFRGRRSSWCSWPPPSSASSQRYSPRGGPPSSTCSRLSRRSDPAQVAACRPSSVSRLDVWSRPTWGGLQSDSVEASEVVQHRDGFVGHRHLQGGSVGFDADREVEKWAASLFALRQL